jgi:hypothetical protein
MSSHPLLYDRTRGRSVPARQARPAHCTQVTDSTCGEVRVKRRAQVGTPPEWRAARGECSLLGSWGLESARFAHALADGKRCAKGGDRAADEIGAVVPIRVVVRIPGICHAQLAPGRFGSTRRRPLTGYDAPGRAERRRVGFRCVGRSSGRPVSTAARVILRAPLQLVTKPLERFVGALQVLGRIVLRPRGRQRRAESGRSGVPMSAAGRDHRCNERRGGSSTCAFRHGRQLVQGRDRQTRQIVERNGNSPGRSTSPVSSCTHKHHFSTVICSRHRLIHRSSRRRRSPDRPVSSELFQSSARVCLGSGHAAGPDTRIARFRGSCAPGVPLAEQ